eukprot:5430929-Alexandrium_andersonii.AAC.1
MGTGDIANCFYAIGVPPELGAFFRLTPVRAAAAGLSGAVLDGRVLAPHEWVRPQLAVLPMGGSWALHLAQLVSAEALLRAGVPGHRLVLDQMPGM